MVLRIELEPDEEEALVERARLSGQDPAQYAQQLIRDCIGSPSRNEVRDGTTKARFTPEDLIDHEFVAACAPQHGEDVPTIEEVREILAKIPGSMANEIIADREDRF